ncbi:MAG: hypothetical protein IH621_01950 [Krumholzibacteria bacterium]|nr:hypothetical protein [Candidatus Krumholzibacteria bacterium]
MKRTTGTIVLFVAALLLAGCAGTKTVELEKREANDVRPPVWWNTPSNDTFLYATATSTSRDFQLAVDKATMDGRKELGNQLELRLRAIASKFDEETGFLADSELATKYKSAVNNKVEQTLVGSRIKDKHMVREGELWRAFVLVELPVAGVNAAVIKGIGDDEALRARLENTKAYKEIGG